MSRLLPDATRGQVSEVPVVVDRTGPPANDALSACRTPDLDGGSRRTRGPLARRTPDPDDGSRRTRGTPACRRGLPGPASILAEAIAGGTVERVGPLLGDQRADVVEVQHDRPPRCGQHHHEQRGARSTVRALELAGRALAALAGSGQATREG
jgi:hypothetical protein